VKRFVFILLLIGTCIPVLSADYVIIVNTANSAADISTANLKRIYTGKISELGGTKVVPINLTLEDATATSFLSDVVGMSPSDYKEFWVNQQVQGQGSAPMVQKSSDAVVAMVSQIPGAIGYIEKDKATADVKVLPVK